MTANKWKKESRRAMMAAYGGEEGYKNWERNLKTSLNNFENKEYQKREARS
jgi:hypothetical protein